MAKEMTIQQIFELVGDMNAQVVGRYFQERSYGTTRLDEANSQLRNCDWLVAPSGTPFLCEVKTVTSVQRGESTEAVFRQQFENRVRNYFAYKRDVRDLPYHLHFNSDGLRLPGGEEVNSILNECMATLAKLLKTLAEREKQPSKWFLDDYCDGTVDLVISPSRSGHLELGFSKYGGVNRQAIEDSLSEATKQVNRSGEDYPGIPRLVVLAFASDVYVTSNSEVAVFDGLAFKEEELWKLVDQVIKRHPELSAVAVMARQINPYFAVFHNPNVSEVDALDSEVFDDGRSVQFSSLETIPRSQPQPFDLQKFVSSIIEGAKADERYAITTADYEVLRRRKRIGS